MPTSFDVNYPQNPFVDITQKTMPAFYAPELYRIYQQQAVYNRFVNVHFNMNGMGATQMHIDSPIMPLANHDPIPTREIWLDASYMDSMRRTITFNH